MRNNGLANNVRSKLEGIINIYMMECVMIALTNYIFQMISKTEKDY